MIGKGYKIEYHSWMMSKGRWFVCATNNDYGVTCLYFVREPGIIEEVSNDYRMVEAKRWYSVPTSSLPARCRALIRFHATRALDEARGVETRAAVKLLTNR